MISTRPLGPMNQEANPLVRLTMIAPKNAAKNPPNVNPGRNPATSASIAALIIRRKTPSERMVMGSVKNIKIGRTTALTIPSRNAAPRSVQPLANSMLGTIAEATHNPAAVMSKRTRTPFTPKLLSCRDG